ncbi:TniB family NTP-binding protein, partial [Paraglaciecola sp.]|uniref:TniB family NTP-binding protein n=1 Tax=Paraglaciecola sp. TaxID=1920173 RepID=UPI00273DA250
MNDFAEKYRLVRELFVASPYLSSLMDEFDECLQDSKLGGAAQCMLVTGNTGSGKTSLINKYIENYPRNELTDRTKVPVLFTSIPENATPIRASQAMLSDLGDPFCYSSNDSEALKKRLITLLKNCQVDLIFIDEFQHLIERKNNKVLHRAADWLKMIIVESNIPVILFGMPYSTVILDVNSQLNGRILFKRKLIPFQINDNHERQNFLKFLKVFDQGLPFEQSS